jgi:hypothetical protein
MVLAPKYGVEFVGDYYGAEYQCAEIYPLPMWYKFE